MAEHQTSIRDGVYPHEANFIVVCSCGQKINVASLSREFAEGAARRHQVDPDMTGALLTTPDDLSRFVS